ncbi:MAG: hypothetical protein NTZ05_04205, partial [Chloroflexi bacterium]|nr:hypothetical protein [Chloroflexota bacterium]
MMKREFIVERDGRSFVLYAGLLDEAHQQGLKSIQTTLVQIPSDDNGFVAICQAVVETDKGRYSGIGDAAPNNVTAPMRNAIIRMAETRAKARALRDATNVSVAALEELGDDSEPNEPLERPQAMRSRNGVREVRERGEGAVARRSGGEAAAAANPEPARATGGASRGAGSDQQATPAQVNAIYAIGRREFHWSDEDVDAHCRAVFGKAT